MLWFKQEGELHISTPIYNRGIGCKFNWVRVEPRQISFKQTEEAPMEFEKKLERLEKIVNQMESGDLNLEESLKSFEEGVRISRECHKELDEAEQKVQLLLNVSADGTPTTKDFTDMKEPDA